MSQATGYVRHLALVVCGCLLVAAGASGAQSTGATAFIDVNVVPMDSERVLTRHTVIIQGDRIISIDPADEVVVPPGAQRVEAQGKYLIPGLIDAHANLLSDSRISDDHLDEELAVLVANGVTTIRHAAGSPLLLEYRERVAAGEVGFQPFCPHSCMKWTAVWKRWWPSAM